jgi:DNA-binding CsgD family transcriptional regulator
MTLIHPSEGMLFTGVAIYRKVEGRAFSDEDVEVADLLLPHLAQAFGIHCRLGGVSRARLALAEVVDRLPSGVILLDGEGRPVVSNRAADQIVEQNDGFYLDERGPRAAMKSDDSALQAMIGSAIAGQAGGEKVAGGFVSLTRPSGLRPLAAMVSPLLEASPESTSSDAAAMLFVSDPDAGNPSTVEMLRSLYGFTQAEAELVQLLISGQTLEEAAASRGVTMNTARSQLKHVFAKTDTKRQGELVRLIVTGVGSLQSE